MSAPDWLTARPIAHRGLHDRAAGIIENSLSAARAAVAHDFAIECDVQDSADGEAVVFHDHSLERLTIGSGEVRRRTARELVALTLLGSTDKIPLLSDLLDTVAGSVPLVVEIKSRFDADMTLTRRTLALARHYTGPVAIKSFDPAVLVAARELAPELVRGIVAEAHYAHPGWRFLSNEQRQRFANLLHLPDTQPQFVSWHVADLPHAAPFLCRHLGRMPVMTWTVRNEEGRARAAEHADQMVFEGFIPV